MDKNIPPCSQWKIWEGKEIEGYTDLNEITLFIRNATKKEIIFYSKKYERIWFCAEYNNLTKKNIAFIKSLNKKVKFDLTYKKYIKLLNSKRNDILDDFQLYVRINNLLLKNNDHIKIGSTFYEESFLIGKGKKVNTLEYFDDKFIK